jgi:hypothetical protein
MKLVPALRNLSRAAIGGALVLAAVASVASGSEGGIGAQAGDTAAYNAGKGVYAAKFACSACPLAGKSLDAAAARELIANKRGVSLSSDESAALAVYLKRRFKL